MVDNLANSEINLQRIAAVENCFGASGQPLAVSERVLVGEGILTKECRKKPKPRIFFLFNDILVYGTIVINKRRYNAQHIIPLEDVTLELLPDTNQVKNRWMIKTSKKSFVVSAASLTERKEWIGHIEECVRQLLEKTGRQPAQEHAAPWIPDRATDICMRCTQTKFSAFTRRHHCRKCGFVVCGVCSKHRFLMPRLSPKPLRVCGLCHRQLLAEKEAQVEEERQKAEKIHLERPVYDPSSEEDSDKSDNDDCEKVELPMGSDFYSSNVSWSAFHR
ncbi:pleckstrin homology domain-containing family F member 1 [Rhinatrema bivittatum]|uniref:pleckstrin homology domain-containing family F member 1 n=1 Tax=Rhinatrema bivittatum TaxID=194408 RepID=UPI0011290E2C|nr:pleckstrin homology domain-containing family F member 1 [Rhinatrema bivittatum]